VGRPDLCVAASVLARSMAKPTERHWRQLKQVVRYVSATKTGGITFGGSGASLEGYTDADFAACKDTRRSRGGMVFVLYGGAVSWGSKLQPSVATSTAESEYMAAALATRELVWLKRICYDLKIPRKEDVVVLKCDNKAAIFMAENSADTARTKHIDVSYHFVRDQVARGAIRVVYCNTDENAADMFTKALSEIKFDKFKRMIGMD
jgi:hypothetical protein